MTPKYRIYYTEYERGWGSRPDGHDDFNTFGEAVAAADAFNSKNTAPRTPDWYMVASQPVLVDADITGG